MSMQFSGSLTPAQLSAATQIYQGFNSYALGQGASPSEASQFAQMGIGVASGEGLLKSQPFSANADAGGISVGPFQLYTGGGLGNLLGGNYSPANQINVAATTMWNGAGTDGTYNTAPWNAIGNTPGTGGNDTYAGQTMAQNIGAQYVQNYPQIANGAVGDAWQNFSPSNVPTQPGVYFVNSAPSADSSPYGILSTQGGVYGTGNTGLNTAQNGAGVDQVSPSIDPNSFQQVAGSAGSLPSMASGMLNSNLANPTATAAVSAIAGGTPTPGVGLVTQDPQLNSTTLQGDTAIASAIQQTGNAADKTAQSDTQAANKTSQGNTQSLVGALSGIANGAFSNFMDIFGRAAIVLVGLVLLAGAVFMLNNNKSVLA